MTEPEPMEPMTREAILAQARALAATLDPDHARHLSSMPPSRWLQAVDLGAELLTDARGLPPPPRPRTWSPPACRCDARVARRDERRQSRRGDGLESGDAAESWTGRRVGTERGSFSCGSALP